MKILWIPHVAWHIPQRAHLFCRSLAEKHEVHVTDSVADFFRPRDYFSLRYVQNFFYRRYRDGNITVHGVPRISPALFFPPVRRFNTFLFERLTAAIIEQYRIDVVVGTFLVPPPRGVRLVFDLFDDNIGFWRSYGRQPGYADEIERIENLYIQNANAIVAVSHALVDRVISLGAPGAVTWIPNGVELSDYDQADGSEWRRRVGVGGHLVGVIGNHDKYGEMEILIEIAQLPAGKNYQFFIAGRGTALPRAQKRVQALNLPNIHFLGALDRKQVPDFLAAMDLGLCPYLISPGAEAASSMRILQYAAAGLPTVCPDLQEVRRMGFSNVIRVADNPEAMVDGLGQAAQMQRARPPQILEYDLPILVRRYEDVLLAKPSDFSVTARVR